MSSKRKTIGIPGWKLGENSFGCGVYHLDYISKFGTPRIIFPEEELADVDMLYLPGGPDLSPFSYKQYPGFFTGNADVYKQFFFEARLDNYIKAKIPIFGVCLGFQMLAAKFGSVLEQDLLGHPSSKDRFEEGHEVILLNGTSIKVNSHHHQGIYANHLGEELKALAVYSEYGKKQANFTRAGNVVEAFMHNTLPIAGVQWHPEEYYTVFADGLFTEILHSK